MKKISRRSFLAGVSALSVSTALAACASEGAVDSAAPADDTSAAPADDAASVVELNVMHYFTEEEAAAGDSTRLIPREQFLAYEADNASLSLNITELQINDYETKIQALATANDMPDVFMVKGSWTSNFVENGILADMAPFLADCEWYGDYRENIFFPVIRGDAIYGAPTQYAATSLCFYNKALWEDAGYDGLPETWEELIDSEDIFAAKDIYPVVLGNKDKWQYNSSWISAIGNRYTGDEWFANILNKDGSAHFTDAEFVAALEMTQNIGLNAGLNPDYSTIDHQQAAALYAQGKSATFIDGYWTLEYLIANCTDEVLANTVVTTHPTVEGALGAANGVAAGCGWFLGVNANLEGEKLQAAMDLVFYITGPDTSRRFVEECGSVGSIDLGESDLSAFAQLQQDYIAMLSEIYPTEIYDANLDASVIATMNDLFPELLAGNITPEDAAAQIEAEYATTLA